MTARPTGRFAHREDGLYLMFDRLFTSPIDDVWASLSRAGGLAGWIGTFTGSPETGAVKFRLDEQGAEWEYVSIHHCVPPKRFTVDIGEGDAARHLILHLVDSAGLTTLTFGQRLHSAADAAVVGAHWDYYFDRLVAAREGKPMPHRAHYAHYAEHYSELIVPRKASEQAH
ncbi:MAG: SRPBCC domain-containing protein [Ramlibacter sp.]|nr:SRPBCC domain-containing protein [Cryobacterium sp.]